MARSFPPASNSSIKESWPFRRRCSYSSVDKGTASANLIPRDLSPGTDSLYALRRIRGNELTRSRSSTQLYSTLFQITACAGTCQVSGLGGGLSRVLLADLTCIYIVSMRFGLWCITGLLFEARSRAGASE